MSTDPRDRRVVASARPLKNRNESPSESSRRHTIKVSLNDQEIVAAR